MRTPKCFVKALAAFALICGLSVSAYACVTATVGGAWTNTAMTAQTGTFTATFDATPSASPTNSVVALSDGVQTAYANFSCLARFNTTGDIDARNGGAFAAASTIPFSAGVSYHFRMVVNVAAQTYSTYVTPAGGSELTVGLNYAFRIAATTLNNWGVSVATAATGGAGTVTVCNFSTSGTLPQAGTPSFSPAPGTYTSAQSVAITTATSGASIRYTTDGSTPSETAGTLYSGPVNISATATLQAIAYESGFTDSTITSGTYTITLPPPTGIEINCGGPAVSPFVADEDFTGGATIDHANTINTSKVTNPAPAAVYQSAHVAATAGAGTTFSYTIGGFTAGSNNTVRLHFCETFWTAAGDRQFNVSINGTQVLTNFDIFATAGGENIANIQQFTEAANASGQYVIVFTSVTDKALISGIEIDSSTTPPQAAAPSFSPGGGSYTSAQSVTITSATSGASIRYTTDGSTPSETAGTIYSAPVSIGATTTLNAIAYESGFTDSAVTGGTYTISVGGTFTITASAGANGSISPSGAVTVNQGASQSFTITPSSGYNVSSVTVDGVNVGAPTSYTFSNVQANHTISAAFQLITYTITASAGANGSISPSGAVTVNQGASQTFAITPNSGFNVSSVTVDGVNVGTPTSYTFSNVQANHTISAAFQSQVVPPPNFGPNVFIFDPTMSSASIQSQIDTIYNQQKSGSTGQFDSARYALLFKPGSYSNTVDVGYYTQVLGLGQSPDDVTITGGVISNAALSGNNATCNFWEGAENLAVIPTGGTDQWAVSQACPMRRVHIKGGIVLEQGGYASGGFLSDCLVDGKTNFGGQQQWFSRNNQSGSWAGGSWNVVYVGDINAPSGTTPNTVINQTPVSREKPFLTIDSSGNYSVFVPALATNSQGITWSSGTPGQSIPISQFYIAQASTDTAATLNAALAQGKNLLLTPGIYSINATLQVNNPNTVVLGLGLATLLSQNGVTTMTVADVDGVTISGILFDAGSTSSPFQLQVGPVGSSASHAANPTLLDDVFFRVGGATLGKTAVSLEINSKNVIGDDFWIWRADHGNSGTVGWTTNTANNGLIVNGANVTIYGLAVEHYQQYQTLWNGNGGSVYFYQSEAPYDPPTQASWMAGSEDGYASYKVADTVTSHTGYGIGVYCNFNVNKAVILGNAIEVPTAGLNGAMMHNMVTVSLGGTGTIEHIIDGEGATAGPGNTLARLAQ